MYTIVIPKSKSKNFPDVLAYGLNIGGVYEDNKLSICFADEFVAYDKLLPLFRLNILNWKETKAYLDDVEVNPYRVVFLAKKKLGNNTRELLENVDFSIEKYTYYHRKENVFYFSNEDRKFELELKGKELFYFVDNYDIGDTVEF